MQSDLREKVERVRQILNIQPDSHMTARFPAGLSENSGAANAASGLPEGLADLLTVTNGPRAGVIAVFPAERVADMQFHCDGLEVLRGGRANWLCFAVGADFPLMIERATGAVWWFPELEAEDYFLTERFERLADDVTEFLDHYILGEGYRIFSPSNDDWWYQFLRSEGLIDEETA